MARDAESAWTEYFAEFRDPIEAYLSSERIEAAVDNRLHRQDKGASGREYMMAIDPATMGDRYAFLIAHMEDTKIIVDYSHIIKPPVNPEAAEDLLFDLVRKFNPYKRRCDTAATVQRLKDKLPALEYTPFTRPKKLAWYGALKEALNLGNLALYQDDDLLDELKALQIRNGVDIAAPKAGKITHDDLSDCLALVCEMLVANVGEVTAIPNPFFDADPRYDDPDWRMIYIDQRGVFVKRKSPSMHPAEFDLNTCKYRNEGCEGCMRSFTNSPEYKAEKERYLDPNFIAMSEEEAHEQFLDNSGMKYNQQQRNQQEANEAEIRKTINTAINIRRKYKRDNTEWGNTYGKKQ